MFSATSASTKASLDDGHKGCGQKPYGDFSALRFAVISADGRQGLGIL